MSARSTRITLALATAGLALAVAGPAFAEPNTGKAPAKKGCSITFNGPGAGQSLEYPDGYKYVVNATDGKTHTYTCNDGKWTETVSLKASGAVLWHATTGTLQLSK
jgi:hypothetical protein